MADRWEELEKRCQNCRECSLCETRTNVVFGDGSRTVSPSPTHGHNVDISV